MRAKAPAAGPKRRPKAGPAAKPKMSAADLHRFLARHFPQIGDLGIVIERVTDGLVRVRLPVGEAHLRPGGTVSGPSMMQLADLVVYLLVLAAGGRAMTEAVTSSMTINFLRRPGLEDMIAEGRLLRLGRSLAVGEVNLYSLGAAEPVAHAVLTYAMPRA